MKPLTEGLICIAMGALIALALFTALMIEESRSNYADTAWLEVRVEGGGE